MCWESSNPKEIKFWNRELTPEEVRQLVDEEARQCYPDGLFEFDTSDRSAPDAKRGSPDGSPPALLRLKLTSFEAYQMAMDLLRAIEPMVRLRVNLNDASEVKDEICLPLSGKLTEVSE